MKRLMKRLIAFPALAAAMAFLALAGAGCVVARTEPAATAVQAGETFTYMDLVKPLTDLEAPAMLPAVGAGIGKDGAPDKRASDSRASYWGILELSLSGNVLEWPGTIQKEPPAPGVKAPGREFKGTHGRGTPALPADWPADVGGAVFRGAPLHGVWGHLLTSGRSNAINVFADRNIHPFPGWRGARTAPSAAAVEPAPARVLDLRMPRLGRPVRPDGVLDEWGKPALSLGGADDVFPVCRRFTPFDYYGRLLKPWQGPGDMSAKVYLGWDGEAVCVAAEVTDDRHFNAKTGDSISSGDTLPKTAGCAVARDDAARITRYELRLPLATLGLEPGAEFGFNIVFFDDDDGSGHRYWLQLAPGLAGSSNIAMYPRFVLAKQTTGRVGVLRQRARPRSPGTFLLRYGVSFWARQGVAPDWARGRLQEPRQ